MSQIIEYSEQVMDHFSNPRNVGEIENASGAGTLCIRKRYALQETNKVPERAGVGKTV